MIGINQEQHIETISKLMACSVEVHNKANHKIKYKGEQD